MALRDPITVSSQVAKLVPAASCIAWSASVPHQDPIGDSSDAHENENVGDCQVNLANRYEAELQKKRSMGGIANSGFASDLQPSGSTRDVLSGPADDLQGRGSLTMGNNSYDFRQSFSVAGCQPALAPTPTPPSPPAGTSQLSFSSLDRNVCACKTSGKLCVPNGHMDIWDSLFVEGYKANVAINTEDGGLIAAHSTVLAAFSPVLRRVLEDTVSWPCNISMKGVPYNAAKVFVRFLYTSRYKEEEMEEFVVQLLVLSHAYCVPSLKHMCTHHLERSLLTNENVVDILQMARLCDAPRLHLLCYQIILKSFKEVARTEGWRAMRDSNPELEQELVEAVIESDYRRQEKVQKMEDDKVYEQLHDAMEALVHICRDGCRMIGPHDKVFDPNKQGSCKYPACKGLESLVRHFAGCKLKVSGGCVHCKRMWQLLELHSQMCQEASCKVPLCGHFRNKIGQLHSERYEMRWRLLVKKVISAKSATSAFSLAALSAKLEGIA